MDPTGRGRKRAGRTGTTEPKPPAREEGETLPPPRPTKERGEFDPDTLWDSEVEEGGEDGERESIDPEPSEDADAEPEANDDLDDWDHPLRRLKIN